MHYIKFNLSIAYCYDHLLKSTFCRKFKEEEMKQAFNMNNKLMVKLQNSSFLDDIK